jgi:hypothetical protein
VASPTTYNNLAGELVVHAPERVLVLVDHHEVALDGRELLDDVAARAAAARHHQMPYE